MEHANALSLDDAKEVILRNLEFLRRSARRKIVEGIAADPGVEATQDEVLKEYLAAAQGLGLTRHEPLMAQSLS